MQSIERENFSVTKFPATKLPRYYKISFFCGDNISLVQIYDGKIFLCETISNYLNPLISTICVHAPS